MADQFAANGYYTVIVDLYNGDPLPLNKPEGFDFMSWLQKGSNGDNPHTFKYVDPIVEKSIAYLKEKGFKKIGSTGYCFVSNFRVHFVSKLIILHRAPNMFAGSWLVERVLMLGSWLILRRNFSFQT
jgi:dienelactone hydrolase